MLLRDLLLQVLDAKKIRMTDEEMVNGGGPPVEIDEDLHSRQVGKIFSLALKLLLCVGTGLLHSVTRLS